MARYRITLPDGSPWGDSDDWISAFVKYSECVWRSGTEKPLEAHLFDGDRQLSQEEIAELENDIRMIAAGGHWRPKGGA
jgi:hypothetical protein